MFPSRGCDAVRGMAPHLENEFTVSRNALCSVALICLQVGAVVPIANSADVRKEFSHPRRSEAWQAGVEKKWRVIGVIAANPHCPEETAMRGVYFLEALFRTTIFGAGAKRSGRRNRKQTEESLD